MTYCSYLLDVLLQEARSLVTVLYQCLRGSLGPLTTNTEVSARSMLVGRIRCSRGKASGGGISVETPTHRGKACLDRRHSASPGRHGRVSSWRYALLMVSIQLKKPRDLSHVRAFDVDLKRPREDVNGSKC